MRLASKSRPFRKGTWFQGKKPPNIALELPALSRVGIEAGFVSVVDLQSRLVVQTRAAAQLRR